jgi:hypothetical protein
MVETRRMRKFILALVLLAACRKHQDNPPSTLIRRVVPQLTDTLLSRPAMDSIGLLCRANGISTANLQFYDFFAASDTVQEAFARIYVNGLPIVGAQAALYFYSGVLSLPSYTDTNLVAANNDTAGHQSLNQLRADFLADWRTSVGGSFTVVVANSYDDTPLTATLVYIPSTYFNDLTTPLTKAWVVQGYYPIPFVWVRDADGQVASSLMTIQ